MTCENRIARIGNKTGSLDRSFFSHKIPLNVCIHRWLWWWYMWHQWKANKKNKIVTNDPWAKQKRLLDRKLSYIHFTYPKHVTLYISHSESDTTENTQEIKNENNEWKYSNRKLKKHCPIDNGDRSMTM